MRAENPDAMRVVFMRSVDLSETLCNTGKEVELVQELVSSQGPRTVRWELLPPTCASRPLSR